jgi:outer membrane receptor protein involved in Fe transport
LLVDPRSSRTRTRTFVASLASLALAATLAPAFLAPTLWSREARADESANEADLHFELATEAYLRGEFRVALEHFLASNRLAGNLNVSFNIAKTYEQLKRYPESYSYYSDVLERETDPARKRAIEEALARIAPNVAVLTITSDPPGATIYLDRKDLGARGTTPRKLAVNPGKHQILLELPGHEDATVASVEARTGTDAPVKSTLVPVVGTIRIDAEPFVEARVDTPDGQRQSQGPGSAKVPPGRHTVYFTAPGYEPTEMTVEVSRNEEVTTRPRLKRLAGTFVVQTDVRDAPIEVDGRVAGFTPSVISVPVGEHKVRVALPGFRPIERSVVIAAGAQEVLDLSLQQVDEVSAVSRVAEAVEDAPSSVSIVTQRELAGMRYPSIAEAVRGVRGVYLTDDRSYTFVGMRGLSRSSDYGNKILILQDGHPLNDDLLGQSFAGYEGRTDLDDVERIEVVRGPGSVLYGTGAFFGVINLVTRRKDAPSLKEVSVSAVDYGMIRGRTTVQERLGEKTSIWTSLSAGRAMGRDFDFKEYRNDAPTFGKVSSAADSWDTATLNGRLTHGDFTMQWFASHRTKRLPTGEYETILGDSSTTFGDTRGTLEARYEPKLSDKVTSLTRAHLNFYRFKANQAYATADGGAAKETYDGRWVGVEQRFLIAPTPALRLTAGGEVQRHVNASLEGHDDTGSYLDASRPYSVAAGYAVADVTPHRRVKVSLGGRYDFVSSSSAGSLNPRAAVIVHPYDAGTVKIMAGKAFRAPSIYELLYQGPTLRVPDKLSPETVYSGEVELSHRLDKTWSVTASSYLNYVQNLMTTGGGGTEEDPLFVKNSPVPVRTLGGEAELRRDFRDGFLLTASYGLQRTSYVNDGGAFREVPNSPTHLGSIRGGFPIFGKTLHGMTRLSFESGRFDRHDTVDDPEPQRKTSGAALWDLVFSGESERGGVSYAFGVYNIGDYRYSAPVSGEFRQRTIPQNGRTLLTTLSLRL